MANIIKLKYSDTLSAAPASLEPGEIAINRRDKLLFYTDHNGVVQSMPLVAGAGGEALADLWIEADHLSGDGSEAAPLAINTTTEQARIDARIAAAGGGGGRPTLSQLVLSGEIFTHLVTYADHFAPNNSGSGTAVVQNALAGKYGIYQLSTGTTATGRGALMRTSGTAGNGNNYATAAAAQTFQASVAFPTLSDITNEYRAYLGWANFTGGYFSSGLHITLGYERSASGDFWVSSTRANGTAVRTAGPAIVAGQFYNIKIEINKAWTEAKFYVDDVLFATHTSQMPPANNFGMVQLAIEKTAGTTARVMYLDWYYEKYNLT